MNVFLWILQLALALLALSGGAYKVFMFDQVANEPWFSALPRGGWSALGVLEMVCGILLIVPAAIRRMSGLTPLAAAALALETVALAGLYAKYSMALTAANPLVWAVLMAALAILVAYGRFARS
jgi:hypothetical protein